MLEYSQGFWYRHHTKSAGNSWWSLVDGYRWWIMVGVCFVGLLLYWGIGSVYQSQEEATKASVVPQLTGVSDLWTRADGEWGAFTQVEPEISAPVFTQDSLLGTQWRESVVLKAKETGIQSPVFFEEPDFICEFLAHPVAFHHCAQMGDVLFQQRFMTRSLADPLSVHFWNAVVLKAS